uniref:Uncharacterized protein n=1 Tax=Anopheles melas TaxID=34690 RepID=A0A182UED2_9DIPT
MTGPLAAQSAHQVLDEVITPFPAPPSPLPSPPYSASPLPEPYDDGSPVAKPSRSRSNYSGPYDGGSPVAGPSRGKTQRTGMSRATSPRSRSPIRYPTPPRPTTRPNQLERCVTGKDVGKRPT